MGGCLWSVGPKVTIGQPQVVLIPFLYCLLLSHWVTRYYQTERQFKKIPESSAKKSCKTKPESKNNVSSRQRKQSSFSAVTQLYTTFTCKTDLRYADQSFLSESEVNFYFNNILLIFLNFSYIELTFVVANFQIAVLSVYHLDIFFMCFLSHYSVLSAVVLPPAGALNSRRNIIIAGKGFAKRAFSNSE